MIKSAEPVRRQASVPEWHHQLLAMLPAVRKHANRAFQYLDSEAREDAVHEVTANAVVAFARLVELGKTDLAYPSVLARYGVAQVREGRRVGNRRRIGEVLSGYARRKKCFSVERLDRFDKESGEWLEAVVEDSRTPVPDQVAFRIDFPDWLKLADPTKSPHRRSPGRGEYHRRGCQAIRGLLGPNQPTPAAVPPILAGVSGWRGCNGRLSFLSCVAADGEWGHFKQEPIWRIEVEEA